MCFSVLTPVGTGVSHMPALFPSSALSCPPEENCDPSPVAGLSVCLAFQLRTDSLFEKVERLLEAAEKL